MQDSWFKIIKTELKILVLDLSKQNYFFQFFSLGVNFFYKL